MNLSDKYTGSLVGVAIGDALGLPLEMHTRKQIIRLLDQEYLGDHDGLIDRYYPIGRHGLYRKDIPSPAFPELQYSSTGICSDDTLLTLAIADSIQANRGIYMDDLVERHVEAVRDEPFGFGKGTRTTMERIADGGDWRDMNDTSFGNGVMMKQSPFAFYEALSGKRATGALVRLARITHAHPVSLVATRVHHKLLVDIILSDGPSFDMTYWLREGVGYAKACEEDFCAGAHVSNLMRDIQGEGEFDISLEDIADGYVRKIGTEKNAYFNVLSTLGICYAIFLRQQDFKAVQQGASIGGDTDSYASVLGSMVGALRGNVFDLKYHNDIHPRYKEKLDKTIHSL